MWRPLRSPTRRCSCRSRVPTPWPPRAPQKRRTHRADVRRAFQPVLETSVTILEPEGPVGTHVFTAMERSNGDTGMRWSVVSLDGGRPHGDVVELHAGTSEGPEVGPIAKEP